MILPFDKIWCLHLAENKEREKHCLNEFKKINIENKVNFWWTCRRRISNDIGLWLDELHNGDYDSLSGNKKLIYGAVFNCSLEHYSIIKTSYYRGFEHILIFEDDIRFVNNINLIKNTFNNIPKDYDIIKFYDIEGHVYDDWYINDNSNNQEFIKTTNFGHSTAFYALSRKGMALYCSLMDKKFVPADNIDVSMYAYQGVINVYRVARRIAYGDNFKSDITEL